MRALLASVAFFAACIAPASAQVGSPVEMRTWFDAAAEKLRDFNGQLAAPSEFLPVSDAKLASIIYDRYKDESVATILEELAKRESTAPAALPKTSDVRGVYSFTQLGHLQVAYMPVFAKMSAGAADELFKKSKAPLSEKAYGESSLAELWIRLGEVEKALAVLDETSSLYVEKRSGLIRTAFASARVDLGRALADSTLAHIVKTSPDVAAIKARHLSHLVVALVDVDEVDRARDVMKQMPACEDALPAIEAICRHHKAHGDDEALANDIGNMLEMLESIDDISGDQATAAIAAVKICVKFRRGEEAVKCFDAFDTFTNQPDPPVVLPTQWAEAARLSLYTTANDRADGYLDRAAKSIAADKDADDGDRLDVDIAIARVYAVRGDIAEFNRRSETINPRLKSSVSFLAPFAVMSIFAELAGVTRDESMLATIRKLVEKNNAGSAKVIHAYALRQARTGDYEGAWKIASTIAERNWRLRSMIAVTKMRLEIPDETEQMAALFDVRTLENPRESAYVMVGVGLRLNGDEGYAGDGMMRDDGLD